MIKRLFRFLSSLAANYNDWLEDNFIHSWGGKALISFLAFIIVNLLFVVLDLMLTTIIDPTGGLTGNVLVGIQVIIYTFIASILLGAGVDYWWKSHKLNSRGLKSTYPEIYYWKEDDYLRHFNNSYKSYLFVGVTDENTMVVTKNGSRYSKEYEEVSISKVMYLYDNVTYKNRKENSKSDLLEKVDKSYINSEIKAFQEAQQMIEENIDVDLDTLFDNENDISYVDNSRTKSTIK